MNRETRNANLRVLDEILGEVKYNMRTLREPAQLLTAFRGREVGSRAYFAGDLTIGGSLSIPVKARTPVFILCL